MTGLVLIIEDNAFLNHQYEIALELVGITPEFKRDGRRAVERIECEPVPDVIVLDLHIPHVSGEEVFETIKAQGLASRVIVITADEVMGERFRGRANDVVIKPTNLEQFLQKILSHMPPDTPVPSEEIP